MGHPSVLSETAIIPYFIGAGGRDKSASDVPHCMPLSTVCGYLGGTNRTAVSAGTPFMRLQLLISMLYFSKAKSIMYNFQLFPVQNRLEQVCFMGRLYGNHWFNRKKFYAQVTIFGF